MTPTIKCPHDGKNHASLLSMMREKMKEKDDEADRLWTTGEHQAAYGAHCWARGIETAIMEIEKTAKQRQSNEP